MTTECHMITNTDNIVLHETAAWHGLGTVVESAPTPGQALTLAGLDWTAEERPIGLTPIADEGITGIKSHKALIRSDNGDVLSVVGSKYRPVQNEELALFCYELSEEGADVRIETAGSLRGGTRVWFLLKGNTMYADKKERDPVVPYMMVYNSHDQTSSVELLPTNIRVVCNNTLTSARSKRGSNATVRFRHTESIMRRVGAASAQIRQGLKNMQRWNDIVRQINSIEVHKNGVDRMFDGIYGLLWGNSKYENAKQTDSAMMRYFTKKNGRIEEWNNILEKELDEHGLDRTPWTVANAVTNWIDHRMNVKLSNKSQHNTIQEAREFNNWFGSAAKRKGQVMTHAMTYAELI